jgi:hypothetical protein
MIWNRVIDRIENNDNFDINKKWTVLDIGIGMRNNYFGNSPFMPKTGNKWQQELNGQLVFGWRALGFLETYSKIQIAKHYFDEGISNFSDIIKIKDELKKAKPWPSKESIIIKDGIICIIFDQNKLDRVLKSIEEKTAIQ